MDFFFTLVNNIALHDPWLMESMGVELRYGGTADTKGPLKLY